VHLRSWGKIVSELGNGMVELKRYLETWRYDYRSAGIPRDVFGRVEVFTGRIW